MKRAASILFLGATLATAGAYQALDYYPASPPAGQAGSTAAHLSDASIVAWADGYENLTFGESVSALKDPVLALGPALGTSYDVLCLGRGGQVTLTFSGGVRDGDGFDFAVYENSFNDTYLELAFVEVSSDGVNFVRFPNYSLNTSAAALDPKKIIGLAGTFRQGYGTPFDLNELTLAYHAALAGDTDFSAAFATRLTNGYPLLDLERVSHVRLVDVIGDGVSSRDARDLQVYDPYPTQITAGFDLDAVAVLNQPTPIGLPQTISFAAIPHQKRAFGSLALGASADSGLAVSYSVSGPAAVTNGTLHFASTGVVEVVASQQGDATYAPAASVARSFRIAEEVQHVFIEPIANQARGGGTVQVRAYSSAGLPARARVDAGPDGVWMGEESLLLELGSETGSVTVRVYQPGDAIHAPAEDVLARFEIVDPGATNAPIPLATWLDSNAAPTLSVAPTADRFGRPAVRLEHARDPRAAARSRILVSNDLVGWTNAVPEIVAVSETNVATRVTTAESNAFFRVELDAQ